MLSGNRLNVKEVVKFKKSQAVTICVTRCSIAYQSFVFPFLVIKSFLAKLNGMSGIQDSLY